MDAELIPLWNIRRSRWQPRDAKFDEEKLVELANSIRDNGLVNPVRVFGYDDADGYAVWELIAGERRTRACVAIALAEIFPQHSLDDWARRLANVGLAGMGEEERAALHKANAQIAATIDTGDMASRHLVAVIENLDRDDLSPLEEGRAYQGLIDAYKWSQRELAARVNKSQGYVAQRLGLLNLNDVAADALNTRVIGMAHARAIAAVPEALQAVATEYVVAEVKKDESPATTRQIENQLRALSAFVDPERWESNIERVYTPQQRNRLAVIRMLVSGPYAEERIAKGWTALRTHRDNYYGEKNLLTARPSTVVDDERLYGAVANALGMRPQDAWQNHASVENKHCASCLFGPHRRPATPDLSAYCPRWNKGQDELRTCERWIGSNDPVVIPVNDYYVRAQLKDGASFFSDPFTYTDNLDAYLTAYKVATEEMIARKIEQTERAENGPRLAIEAFFAWQQTLPAAHLGHSQAHACVHCAHHEPLFDSKAPCRFAINPLKSRWGDGGRAPEMGVLCGPTLTLLPRCEMFVRKHLPMIYRQPGFTCGKNMRKNFLEWMRAAKINSNNLSFRARAFMWRGVFAWLPIPHGDATTYSWDDIQSYLGKYWDAIDDGGMATLMTALLFEVKAATSYRVGPIELLDLVTCNPERWMPIVFDELKNEHKDWPDGWARPWMTKTLVETLDDAGMLDDEVVGVML